jgi:hypothetical protein
VAFTEFLDVQNIATRLPSPIKYVSPLALIKTKKVRFEVFTAVSMKNGVFWDVTPCGSCKNRRFGGI